jgi:uncharacterized protein (TIGR02246 family)
MKMNGFVALGILWLLLSSCWPAPTTPKQLTEADRKRITEVEEAYAKGVMAKDPSAAAAVFTEDAIFLDPNSKTVRGRGEIERFFQALFAGQTVTGFSLTPVEVFGVDGLAYEVGTWRLSVNPPEGTSPLSQAGSYVFALKKQSDGSWKIAVDIGNSSQPSATP